MWSLTFENLQERVFRSTTFKQSDVVVESLESISLKRVEYDNGLSCKVFVESIVGAMEEGSVDIALDG